MTGGRRPRVEPPGALAPPPAAGPWTAVWGAALALRRRAWAKRARRLAVPVVSIGNLHVGGSGKTPLTAAIARHLRDGGQRVAILSRGYGRRTRGVRVASRGAGPTGGPAAIGDEPFLLARELPGVAVVVGEDRYRAGLTALAALDPVPEILVLDDGFSHLALARDLDLLAFPADRPWGNGRLLPFGSLREPLAAATAAQAAILTGVPGDPPGAADALAAALRPVGFTGACFASSAALSVDPRPSGPVVLATGVARPERVLAAAQALGLDVRCHLAFADHHDFPARSLERIAAALERTGATALVVTSKDRAKIEGRLAAPLCELRLEARPEAAFWRWLDERLAGPARSAAGER